MKTRLLTLVATAFFAPFASAAILFSGGHDGIPVTLTITEDITIPINQTSHTTVITMVLKGAYESVGVQAQGWTQTDYSESTAVKAQLIKDGGFIVNILAYNVWGKAGEEFGDLGVDDFFGTFEFSPPDFGQIEAGDSFLIKAGSIVLNSSVLLPNAQPVSILLIDDLGNTLNVPVSIPEPSAVWLAATGSLLLFRRKRMLFR